MYLNSAWSVLQSHIEEDLNKQGQDDTCEIKLFKNSGSLQCLVSMVVVIYLLYLSYRLMYHTDASVKSYPDRLCLS